MIIGNPGRNEVCQGKISRDERHSGGLGYPYIAQILIFHKLAKKIQIGNKILLPYRKFNFRGRH